ncbi:MAG: hypothetical protein HY905_04820 [Deltaproteobacteria bacterium]|nr:hypothetical protein [Deltaproteobacteria bacterium]
MWRRRYRLTFRPILAIAAVGAALAGCRGRAAAPDAAAAAAGTLAAGPEAPAASDAPLAEGPPEVLELIPPIPSAWVPGTEFHAPPPVELTASPSGQGFNMLMNPGFEDGTEPWWYFPDRAHWGGFTVSTARAAEGRWAARLELLCDESHPPPDKAHIRGVIQDISTPVFPTIVSGNYYVETWERGTVDQYIQFVVIVAGAAMAGGPMENIQIRYLLAGIDHPPFDIQNAKFFYVTREEPVVGRWIHFERNLEDDFIALWGAPPDQFSHVRVLFEVRWDNVDVQNPPRLHSVVYFDDLHLGT